MNKYIASFSLFILFTVFGLSDLFAGNEGGGECRKFKEGLYLQSALNNQAAVSLYLDSVTSCSQQSPQQMLSLGKFYYDQAKYEDSRSMLLPLVEDHLVDGNELVDAYCYLGMIAYELDNYLLSIEFAEKAVTINPEAYWCLNNIGLSYNMLGEYDLSDAYYNRALKFVAKSTSSLNGKAVNFNNQNRLDSALFYYKLACEYAGGTDPLYHSNVTRCLRDMRKHDEELIWAEEGIRKFPGDKRILKDIGTALAKHERYDEALTYGRKLWRMKPESPGNYFDIAYLYDVAGRMDTAFLIYSYVLKLDPDYSAAHTNIGIIYNMWGNFEKAEEHHGRAYELNPTDEYVLNSNIQTNLWQRKFEKALIWAERYNELYMGGYYSYLNTGYILMNLERYEEAIPWFIRKLEQKPDDDRAMNNMGRCYAKLGDHITAYDYFEKALAVNPENSYTYHNRASLNYDMKKYDEACRDLQLSMEKSYTWTIDSTLFKLQKNHCPDVNLDRKVLINAYTGNQKELNPLSFVAFSTSEDILKELPAFAQQDSSIVIPPTSSKVEVEQGSFNIYPNPSNGPFSIHKESVSNEDMFIKIFDSNGRLVNALPYPDNIIKLNLRDQGPGTYLIMILDESEVLDVQKVIIQ